MIITDVIPSYGDDDIEHMEYFKHKVLTNYDVDPDFMTGLSPEDKNYAIQIYEELVKQVYSRMTDYRMNMDDDEYKEFYRQNESINIELIDENGEKVFCQLELGNISDTDFEEYSHYAYFKLHRGLKAIKFNRLGEEEFHTNEELLKVFEGLNFISSGDCYDRTLEYCFSNYKTSLDDLLVIREEHRSPKEANEELLELKTMYNNLKKMIEEREAQIIEKRKRMAEEIDRALQIEKRAAPYNSEEELEDVGDGEDNDKKYGVVTLKRSYEIIKEMKKHNR